MNNNSNQKESRIPVKSNNLHFNNWLLVFFSCCLLIWGCNETLSVGSEILPNSDGQGNVFSDTTTIISTTVSVDSLRSDKLFLSQLGYMNDAVFGKTKSSLLLGLKKPNLTVSSSILDTIGGYQLDSVVLSLTLNGIYGDLTLPMNFKVHKLLTPLSNEQVYFSNTSFDQGMLEVGSKENYVPSLVSQYDEYVYNEDSTYVNLAPQLRIRLDPFFGQSIINLIENDQVGSDEILKPKLPGLVVVPEELDGSILELDMFVNSFDTDRRNVLEDSRLHIYYKNVEGTPLNVIFPATVQDLGIGQYSHDYNSTNIETALNSNNPLGDQVSYIQGLAGVKTKIEFPNIESYGNIAIQKAELVVSRLEDGFEETFLPPDRLFVVKVAEDGTNEDISDFTMFADAHTDGFSNEITEDNGDVILQYRINISDHLQKIISGEEENNGLYISLYGTQDLDLIAFNTTDIFPDRIVIGGGSNTQDNYRLRLDMTYTILD